MIIFPAIDIRGGRCVRLTEGRFDQETVFAPSHDAVSTYPSFATPQEVGDAIIKAGFDVVESATNLSLIHISEPTRH